MNDCDLRVSGLVSALEGACTAFCTHNAVKIEFKRRNITDGNEITHNLRQNQRVTAIFDFLGSFPRWKTRALRFACKME